VEKNCGVLDLVPGKLYKSLDWILGFDNRKELIFDMEAHLSGFTVTTAPNTTTVITPKNVFMFLGIEEIKFEGLKLENKKQEEEIAVNIAIKLLIKEKICYFWVLKDYHQFCEI
jgi:hypothetical protein